MKTARKVILVALCAVLLVVSSVMGTLAYLTAEDTVTNTFTVGNVQLKLEETKVDEMGAPVSGADPVKTNEYHLLPGHTYTKDPTVTILPETDESYVRMIVKVKNVDSLKNAIKDASYYYEGNTSGMFLLEKLCTGWDAAKWQMNNYKVETVTEKVTDAEGNEVDVPVKYGIYEFRYYKTVINRTEEGTTPDDLELEPLFTKISVPGEVNNAGVADLAKVEIIVEAHAIQADGFADAATAWKNFTTN